MSSCCLFVNDLSVPRQGFIIKSKQIEKSNPPQTLSFDQMFATALPLNAAPRKAFNFPDDLESVLQDLKKAEDNDTCSMGSTFMSSNAREEEIDDMTGWTEQFNLPK